MKSETYVKLLQNGSNLRKSKSPKDSLKQRDCSYQTGKHNIKTVDRYMIYYFKCRDLGIYRDSKT